MGRPSDRAAMLVGLLLLPLLMLSPSPAAADLCPGSELLACPNTSTCCRSNSEQQPFVCCPYQEAVCCADGLSCCRKGFTCDLSRTMCVRVAPQPGLCPDGKSKCPVSATCCQLPSRRWGCCPYRNAVCCSDMLHCCPQGTRCDLKSLTCVTREEHPMLRLMKRKMEVTKGHYGLRA